jgi:nicotinamidase-related amidase
MLWPTSPTLALSASNITWADGGILPDPFHLHGARRRKCSTALLLIDVINDMEFPDGGDKLLRQTLPAARKIAALKKRAVAAGVPVIYVNDNFGKCRSDFKKQVRHCLQDGVRGEPVARLLAPAAEDYFVLKPKSSSFFGTTLHSLLNHLEVTTLVLTGVAADVCILFTAHDAHLRDYQIIVPSDCVASNFKRETTAALANMKKATHAVVCESPMIHFSQGKVRTKSNRAKALLRAA